MAYTNVNFGIHIIIKPITALYIQNKWNVILTLIRQTLKNIIVIIKMPCVSMKAL